MKRADGWIQLYGGIAFDFNEPSLDDVPLSTIAHSLAHQCRFNGHCTRFYSVAEHSVGALHRARKLKAPIEVCRAALMHDAAEAIICDLPRPLRRMPAADGINEMIATIERLVRQRWPAAYNDPAILQIDLELLATEKEQLMHPAPRDWGPLPEPPPIKIIGWNPEMAKTVFVLEAERLGINE